MPAPRGQLLQRGPAVLHHRREPAAPDTRRLARHGRAERPIVGIVGSEAVKTKAAGINVNLWTGLGMLVFGALMVFWALSRPVEPNPGEAA